MLTWVAIALSAAFFQSIRVAGMRILMRKTSLSLTALSATQARYFYGWPFVTAFWLIFCLSDGDYAPHFEVGFALGVVGAGLMQIVATDLLMRLLARRNFLIGNALTKTSTVITALLAAGLALFGWQATEALSLFDWAMILLSIAALLLATLGRLTLSWGALMAAWDARSVALGLGSGLAFAFCALGIVLASQSSGLDSPFQASLTSLFAMVSLQAVALGLWLLWRQPGQTAALLQQGRGGWFVGVTSSLGSVCWFWAFALAHPALVQAVAQAEFLFSLLIGLILFQERPQWRELLAVLLLATAIVGLVVSRA